jgi:hypothetical protein
MVNNCISLSQDKIIPIGIYQKEPFAYHNPADHQGNQHSLKKKLKKNLKKVDK